MPKTRLADYYLGCLDSSVFIDFNQSENNRISLVRISFDGYGCCNLKDKTRQLGKEESFKFINEIKQERLNQEIISRLVKEIIEINKDQIWQDALKKYGLIE